jgi:hypothetical protein
VEGVRGIGQEVRRRECIKRNKKKEKKRQEGNWFARAPITNTPDPDTEEKRGCHSREGCKSAWRCWQGCPF